jgi:hypothetical protein
MLDRRSLITGLVSLVAAPAIVRASSLMPVKTLAPTLYNLNMFLKSDSHNIPRAMFSFNGGAYRWCDTVTEMANGWYQVGLRAEDIDGENISVRLEKSADAADVFVFDPLDALLHR